MSIKLFLISINTADTYAFFMHSILGAGNRSATVASRSSTCSLNRRVCAPHGTSHDQMVCFEGLPDLPGAPQGYGRPTSNTLLSRFAPARRPDQIEGRPQVRPESSFPLWCVCPRYPGAGTRSGEPIGRQLSESVCMPKISKGRDTERRAHRAPALWVGVCPRFPRAGTRSGEPVGASSLN